MFTLLWVVVFIVNAANTFYNVVKDNTVITAFVGAAAGFSLAMIMISLNL